MSSTRISVQADRPYDVVIGRDLLPELGPLLGAGARVGIVHPARLRAAADSMCELLPNDVHLFAVPDGEGQKDIAVAASLWDSLGRAGFTRSDALIGLGGGATTDLAGFVAATWLRGVRVVHVPTTLLAMVDAAVGGKTGVNTAAGKNLVGAFHSPAGVLVDLTWLETVPRPDYVSGVAEIVKVGFTHDPTILDLVEADPRSAAGPGGPHTRELVERAIAVKAKVVGADLTERGEREHLNYGHTLGHAIERLENYTWRHGDAVSVGLVYAAELGRLAGLLDQQTADRHRHVLESIGLPTSYGGDWAGLHEVMAVDKKSRGSSLRFVVLEGLARPRMLEDPDPSLLVEAYEAVSRDGTREVLG